MPARRSLLRKVGLTGVGTAVGITVLPSPRDSTGRSATVEGAEPPEAVAPWTDGPIETEGETPIARYHYAPTDDGFVPTAPVNVVFVPDARDGERELERVMRVLDGDGWVRNPEEYTRFAWDREQEQYVRQQETAAETYYGTSGRRHVRCWSFGGIVSMQAHEDTGAWPNHKVASYVRGRETIESIFAAAGWRISPGAIDLANDKAPDHDGMATVITEER